MRILFSPFWNWQEQRFRSGWRLLIHFILYSLAQGLPVLFLAPNLVLADTTSASIDVTAITARMEPIPYFLLILLGVLSSTWLVTRFLDRRRFSQLGFQFSRSWWLDFVFGLLLGALLMCFIFVVEWLAGWVTITGWFQKLNPQQAFWQALLPPLVVFIVVGIQEELLSRGYQIRNLAEGLARNSWGEYLSLLLVVALVVIVGTLLSIYTTADVKTTAEGTWLLTKNLFYGLLFSFLTVGGALFLGRAIGLSQQASTVFSAWLATSAFFGLLHYFNPNATPVSTFNIALAGIALGIGYVLTGQLAISIGVHITWNFFQGNIFGFPVSGIDFNDVTLIVIQQGGPTLWTGGNFGPEAGVIGIVAIGLEVLLIWLWVRWRYGVATIDERLGVYQGPTNRSHKM